MNQWEQVILWVAALAVVTLLERQIGQIIALLQEIRDRLPPE